MRYNRGNMVYNLTTRIKKDISLSIAKASHEGDMEKVQRNIERKQWLSLKEMDNEK